jgi:Asp-tRNA(Asn)/Glu-tRNA(Gln) amidotransferase A subunit family amidase
MANDLLFRPLDRDRKGLRAKQLTARELVEAAIARHGQFGERLHAYSQWAPEQAHAVAQAADATFASGMPIRSSRPQCATRKA